LPPKAIIFDIGRVIVRVDVSRLLEPLAALLPAGSTSSIFGALSPQQIWQAIEADPRWRDWQEGRMTPQEWHEHITGGLGLRIGFANFCQAWNQALDPDLILDESLFEALGKGHKLALLSNIDPLHSAHIESDFPFTRHFPVRIYSWQIGAVKPKPAIFHAALKALDVTPGDALYIDDTETFATAARQLGLDSIRFENPAQLGEQLSRRGLPGACAR
jgi:FMN phosphatase YigB (HAD superfamily)